MVAATLLFAVQILQVAGVIVISFLMKYINYDIWRRWCASLL